MYQIKINNCNNIKEGNIQIEKNKLNIKYGINGTGKTTIAKAIQKSLDNESLQQLQSFNADAPASVTIIPSFQKVLTFNEEFINQVVFIQDEVIEKSFEVFLKTPDYDEKKTQLDNHLNVLKEILLEDKEIFDLKDLLKRINERFKRTSTGKLSNTGTMKSLLSKQNLYNIPDELEAYRFFFENKDNNIPWIDWVNRGDVFDTSNSCPYCAEKLDMPKHIEQKKVFKDTYTKADSQNLKDILELFEDLRSFIHKDKYDELINYIKSDTPVDIIKAIIEKLTTEIELLIARFNAMEEFGKRNIAIAEISKLDQQIAFMELPNGLFEIFGGEKIERIFERINDKVLKLKAEVMTLKHDMGELKALMLATVKASQMDINEFLKTAGINYELIIQVQDETNSRAILKQCFDGEKTDVKDIRQHLSWGEKNAFSLILFMYYAQMQSADLIILDDPVSSFDNNKKYAILHRMFKNIGKRDISFENRTVLLLTHDFEPITDFIVVGKLNEDKAIASFVWNEGGNLQERSIDSKRDVCLIAIECERIARNNEVNIISRVAFLRKLCELNGGVDAWGNAYQILSCLIHASDIKKKSVIMNTKR